MQTLIRFLAAVAPIAVASAQADDPVPVRAVEPLSAAAPAPLVRAAKAVDDGLEAVYPNALRVRPVHVDPQNLERLGASGPLGFEPGALEVELFPGEVWPLAPERWRLSSPRAFTASGTVVGRPDAHWSLAVRGGVVLFNLRPHDGTVHGLRMGPDGQALAVQVRPPAGMRCACDVEPQLPGELGRTHGVLEPDAAPAATGPQAVAGSLVEIQLLVLLTPNAVDDLQGGLAARTAVELAVEEANQVFANSEVGAEWKLEAAVQVRYNEDGAALTTHLNRLTNDDDGFFDEIHEYRGVLNADFVSLIVDDTDNGQFGGFAWVQPPPPTTWNGPFSVVDSGNMVGNLTLAHELGHNMGLGHDLASNPQAQTITTFANGWNFTGSSGSNFRTVMSVGGETRIPYYSDPGVKFDGQGTGSSGTNGANAAQAVRDFLWLHPTYGFSGIPSDLPNSFANFGAGPFQLGAFNTPFDKLMEAVLQVNPAGGTVFVGGGGSTSEAPLLWFEREFRADANDPDAWLVGT